MFPSLVWRAAYDHLCRHHDAHAADVCYLEILQLAADEGLGAVENIVEQLLLAPKPVVNAAEVTALLRTYEDEGDGVPRTQGHAGVVACLRRASGRRSMKSDHEGTTVEMLLRGFHLPTMAALYEPTMRRAEAEGWKVTDVYHLEGVSGKRIAGHPETQRMLSDIRSGKITALIFSKLARLARNTSELLEFADMFRKSGADLVSLQESIDTSTPAGRLFYTMLAAMAQWEREEIVERINASVPIRAKLGKPLGGAAPYGYQWQDRKLVIHPEEGPIRKMMHEIFLETRRKKAVASRLNNSGYRTRKGVKFCAATVGRLIQDSTAKGMHRTNYTRRTGNDEGWEFKPESDWVIHPVEPLISEELWQQCNDLLGARGPVNKPSKRTAHLFAGLVFCGCGAKMYVPSNSPKYICPTCRNKIPATDLENIFFEQLQSFLVSPEQINAYLGRAQDTLIDKKSVLNSRQKELEKTRHEVEKTYRLYLDNQLTGDAFGKFFKPIEERQKQLEEEVPRIQAEIDFMTISALSSDQVMSDAHTLEAQWPTLPKEEKRNIVECITDKITVAKGEITIDLCYLPSSKELVKREWSLGGSNP